MQPVQYNGQEYYTSQYFHRQYIANSVHGGKYQRHGDFLRLLRTIETYKIYIQQGDIVELVWSQVNSRTPNQRSYVVTEEDKSTSLSQLFKPLFQAINYNPLTLLNATAQLALSHHLDDEINKQLSVAVNTAMATPHADQDDTLPPYKEALVAFAFYLTMGKLLNAPLHILEQEGVKQLLLNMNIDCRFLLAISPAQNNIPETEMMLEPTELAAKLGIANAVAMNRYLYEFGLQVRSPDGTWEPTPLGAPHCIRHAWQSHHSTKSGYNLKWNVRAIYTLLSGNSTND
jgi:hypothetical protein